MVRNNGFGRRLKKEIRRNGMFAKDLAQITGLGDSAISHFVSGRRLPSFASLELILNALPNVDAREFITGIKSKTGE